MGSSLQRKIPRSTNFYRPTVVRISSATSRLNGEYHRNENHTDNQLSAFETAMGLLYTASKFDELWSTTA